MLTPHHGKVSLLAKGVRRSKSKLAGGLELFSVTNLSYIDGRSELKTVVSTQLAEYFSEITKSIEVTMCAYNFLKHVDALTEHSCEPAFFDLLVAGFRALNQRDCEPSVNSAWFYASLLNISGHGINLERTASGEPFSEQSNYMFDFDAMGFVVHSGAAFSPKHIKLLRLFSKVSAPENLLHVDGAPQLAAELIPLLEKCLQLSK